jgi:hypothetical protein
MCCDSRTSSLECPQSACACPLQSKSIEYIIEIINDFESPGLFELIRYHFINLARFAGVEHVPMVLNPSLNWGQDSFDAPIDDTLKGKFAIPKFEKLSFQNFKIIALINFNLCKNYFITCLTW